MIEKKLQQLFQQYIKAFQHYDLESVVRCYAFPCTLTTPDKVVLLNSADDAKSELSEVFSWMQQDNATKIGVLSASYHQYSSTLVVANIQWQFVNAQAQVIAEFAALYHLDVTSEQAKIVHVVSHEIAGTVDLEKKLTIFD